MGNRCFRHMLMLVLLWGTVPMAAVLAQDLACQRDPGVAQDSLASAQRLFGLELYDEVVRALGPCVPALDRASQREALRLLAISYYETGEQEVARRTVRQLVRSVDRRYPEDNEDDPLYLREWVAALRPKWYENTWVQIGGVAVVGGVLSLILLQPENRPPEPVAGPPLFPPPSQ